MKRFVIGVVVLLAVAGCGSSAPAAPATPAVAPSTAYAEFLSHITAVAADLANDGTDLNNAINLTDMQTIRSVLGSVQTEATTELAWANANPPADCYRAVWQAFHDSMNSFVQGTAIAVPWAQGATENNATYPPDAFTFTKAGGDAMGGISTLETSIHC